MIANLCLSNKPVISSRVLCGERHTRNNARGADILPLCKGNQYYYVDKT